jgi:enoyl-CoA hydratase
MSTEAVPAPRVTYELDGGVARIGMDDGKANALSPAMLLDLNNAFVRAEVDGAVVVLSGRPGLFSGGFDLKVIRAGGYEAVEMVRAGFELTERILAFPTPVVMVCTGHALAMGTFLLLAGDHRIGVSGPFKFAANEVAIGLTMPRAAVEMLRQRLTPAHFNRACILAETFTPEGAAEAGFLDRVVDAGELDEAVSAVVAAVSALDMRAHAATKRRAREQTLTALRAAIEADYDEARRPARNGT